MRRSKFKQKLSLIKWRVPDSSQAPTGGGPNLSSLPYTHSSHHTAPPLSLPASPSLLIPSPFTPGHLPAFVSLSLVVYNAPPSDLFGRRLLSPLHFWGISSINGHPWNGPWGIR